LLTFCSIRRYSHIGLGVRHVEIIIIVGTHIAFVFCENPFCMELGFGVVVGASHPHGGINNSNLMLSLEGVPKLSH